MIAYNRYTLIALSVTGGLLSGLAWTGWCPGLILLFSFIPYFLIEDRIYNNRERYTPNAFFIYILPGFFIFSIMTLGWMRVASMTAAITVIIGMSFLMSFTMWLAHVVRLRAGNIAGFVAVVSLWLTLEYATLNINIITPWINLGNGLAKDILFIQWYEFTGTGGGSLWILLSNILLAAAIVNYSRGKSGNKTILTAWLIIAIIPSVYSVTRYYTIKQTTERASEVVIVQPNSDPYTEKFRIPFPEQLENVIEAASASATENSDWILTPETVVDDPIDLEAPGESMYIRMIKRMARQFPDASVIAGMVTYKIYPPAENPPTKSARIMDESGAYYDHFNSAFRIDTGELIEVYHKSKLVPGIEMQFSNGLGRIAAKILPYLGGTKWGYGIQEERSCFEHPALKYKVAPIICYESVFGNYVAEYVRNGAEALFIITNDGWWKNTNGYRQHLSYASLRAIETRRPVARAANTGISCIIDKRGKRVVESAWWEKTVLRGKFYPESEITTYVKYGDYILIISLLISIILLGIVFVALPVAKKFRFF
jgi:apolipoprotein N-acyltransferase